MAKGATSPTREAETSEFDLIDIKMNERLKELQNELIHHSKDDTKSKMLKAEFRKILRETMRELKYCENVGIDKYMKAPTDITEIKTLLRDLKSSLLDKGFRNFYLEYHQGKKGENHIQILSNSKDKEKEIMNEIIKELKKDKSVKKDDIEKPMVKDDYDIQMEKMLKRLEEIEKRTQSISEKIDTLYSKYETVIDIQTKKIDITNINERLEKLERRQKNG